MKTLVWVAIKPENVKTSIWETIDDEKVAINKSEFELEFCRSKNEKNISTQSQFYKGEAKQEKVRLLA